MRVLDCALGSCQSVRLLIANLMRSITNDTDDRWWQYVCSMLCCFGFVFNVNANLTFDYHPGEPSSLKSKLVAQQHRISRPRRPWGPFCWSWTSNWLLSRRHEIRNNFEQEESSLLLSHLGLPKTMSRQTSLLFVEMTSLDTDVWMVSRKVGSKWPGPIVVEGRDWRPGWVEADQKIKHSNAINSLRMFKMCVRWILRCLM